jgi:glycosyltransferase involved in cell wall biosynthesis
MIIGIDASNVRAGGGLTYLKELLNNASLERCAFNKIIVWSNTFTLANIKENKKVIKQNHVLLNKSLIYRILWQNMYLKREATRELCDIIFVPGGILTSRFQPAVTMSQNMLPFSWKELFRYGVSWTTLRLIILRIIQSHSFRKADGVIYLTKHAKSKITNIIGASKASSIIPHGVSPWFRSPPKPQKSIYNYSFENPIHLIYVSIIDNYKHQNNIVISIGLLRKKGFPVVLSLVGPAYPPALKRLNKTIDIIDKDRKYINYNGHVDYSILHEKLKEADIGIFASTCENLPIVLLEKMASGLPLVCSNSYPMPEILGGIGAFIDPLNPYETADIIEKFILSTNERKQSAENNYRISSNYTWDNCTTKTFEFLLQVASDKKP